MLAMGSRTVRLAAVAVLTGGILPLLAGPPQRPARVRIGEPFPDLSDVNHFTRKPIRLSDFRGKVVLLDFWASWCGPCRRELPNVQRAFRKYHDFGFEIIGISLDSDRGRFERFVKSNDMPWYHIFDGKGWNARLAVRFGVRAIPATFLIGRDGRLVAAGLRGPALEHAIWRALGQQGAVPGNGPTVSPTDLPKPATRPAPPPAAMRPSDMERAQRWFRIAEGMRVNQNYGIARKYYQRIIATYPDSEYARKAREALKRLPSPSGP